MGCKIFYRCTIPITDTARIHELGKTNKKWIVGQIEAFLGGDIWCCYFGHEGGIKNLGSSFFTVIKPPDFMNSHLNPWSSSSLSTVSSHASSLPWKKANTQDSPIHSAIASAANHVSSPKDPPGQASSVVTPCAANCWGLGALPVQQKLTDMVCEDPDKYKFDPQNNSKLSNWTPSFAKTESILREYWKMTRELAAARAEARAASKKDRPIEQGGSVAARFAARVAADTRISCHPLVGYCNQQDDSGIPL